MHPRSEEFVDRARAEVGFEPDIHELPEGTHTAQDAADAIGCELAQIAKSMVMSVGDDIIIVFTSGANRVDNDALAAMVGVAPEVVSPADPDHVKEVLGWSIGGVPPFCHDTIVDTYIDPALLEHDEVWAGGGTPKAVFPIDPTMLKELTDAIEAEVTTA